MKNSAYYKIIGYTALVLFSFSFKYAYSQSDITAIDILLDPGKTMVDSAKVYNELMRKNYAGPGSYSLDTMHSPHITVLQCFVKTRDLDKVYAAVAKVVKGEQPAKETITTSGFYYVPNNDLGLAGITVTPTPKLVSFQLKIIETLKPFMVVGTDAGFIQNADGTPIVANLTKYVNGFVTDHGGANFSPHVSIGLAKQSFLKELMAKPYRKFTFKCSSVSVYHLGDFGTARRKLWTSLIN